MTKQQVEYDEDTEEVAAGIPDSHDEQVAISGAATAPTSFSLEEQQLATERVHVARTMEQDPENMFDAKTEVALGISAATNRPGAVHVPGMQTPRPRSNNVSNERKCDGDDSTFDNTTTAGAMTTIASTSMSNNIPAMNTTTSNTSDATKNSPNQESIHSLNALEQVAMDSATKNVSLDGSSSSCCNSEQRDAEFAAKVLEYSMSIHMDQGDDGGGIPPSDQQLYNYNSSSSDSDDGPNTQNAVLGRGESTDFLIHCLQQQHQQQRLPGAVSVTPDSQQPRHRHMNTNDRNSPDMRTMEEGTLRHDTNTCSNPLLVEATLVTQNSASEPTEHTSASIVVEAEAMEDRDPTNAAGAKQKLLLLMALFVVVSLVAGLAAGFAVANTTSANEVPQSTLPPIRRPPFRDDLDPVTISMMTSDPHGPAALANEWMLDDPYLANYTDERSLLRYGMAAFYYSTNGDQWIHNEGWLNYDVHECDWYSSHPTSVCNDEKALVIINITNNNLNGVFPHEVKYITGYNILDLSYNQIAGPAPTLGPPQALLETLVLSHNLLTGQLSADITTDYDYLRVVLFAHNKLNGHIPQLIFLIPELEVCDLSYNSLEGDMENFVFGPKLNFFNASANLLTGSLPKTLGSLSFLRTLDMSKNGFAGTIPLELAGMANLTFVDVTETQLSGSLPSDWCQKQQNGLLEVKVDCDQVQCCVKRSSP